MKVDAAADARQTPDADAAVTTDAVPLSGSSFSYASAATATMDADADAAVTIAADVAETAVSG